MSDTRTAAVILCEPPASCRDAHVNRWHCMRGHALDEDHPKTAGVCHLKVCVVADRAAAVPA